MFSINSFSQEIVRDCNVKCDLPILIELHDKNEFVCSFNEEPYSLTSYIEDFFTGELYANTVSIDKKEGIIIIEGQRRYSTLNEEYDSDHDFNLDSAKNKKVKTVLVKYYEEYTYLDNIVEKKIYCRWKRDSIEFRFYKPIPSGNWTIISLDGVQLLNKQY